MHEYFYRTIELLRRQLSHKRLKVEAATARHLQHFFLLGQLLRKPTAVLLGIDKLQLGAEVAGKRGDQFRILRQVVRGQSYPNIDSSPNQRIESGELIREWE